jgi:Leucine-rich repeat (LRR) protein
MKRIVFLSLNLLWTTFVLAQVVNIPDANFKQVLVDNPSINTNGDAEIQVSEAVAYTGKVDVFDKGIKDLTGIEAFVNIIELYCGFNFIKTLDVSKNIALKTLYCQSNAINVLNVQNNIKLTSLICSGMVFSQTPC